MLSAPKCKNQLCSLVLESLKPVDVIFRNSMQNTVTIVSAADDQCPNTMCTGVFVNEPSDTPQVA